MKSLWLLLLLAGCASPPSFYDGVQRCVMAPLGSNAQGAIVVLMRCQAEGEAV